MTALAALALLAAAPFHHPHDVVNAVALSPDFGRDGTVFCASAGTMNLFLLSEDRGHSWRNSRSGMFGWEVRDLAVAPDWTSSRTAFAALGKAGLQRTRDGGRTWGARIFDGPVSKVVAGPVGDAGRVIAFAGAREVRLSRDDGDTHSLVFTGENNVMDLAFSPAFASDSTLAVTTREGRAHVSRDGGASWSACEIPGVGGGIAISPDFARDGTLWVATFPNGLLVSTDWGRSFSKVESLAPQDLSDVVVAPDWPASRDLFVAAMNDGVFRSRDGGATWSRCGLDLAISDQYWKHYLQLALSPAWPRDQAVYCGAFEGLYHSADGGETWVESALDATHIGRHVEFSPAFARDRTLVALAYGNPAMLSEDAGATWDMRSRGIGTMSTYAIGVSPGYERDGTLFLGTAHGLMRSRDRGRVWEPIRLEPAGPTERGWAYEVRSIRFSPGFDADRGVLALSEAGLFLSDDGGDSWRRFDVPERRAWRLAVSPAWPAERTLFIGGASLRRSDDGGVTWSEPLAGGDIAAVACATDFASSREVFALSVEGGFLRSADGGRTFESLPEALGGFSPTTLRLSPAFERDGTLWVTTLSGGIRVSRDRGRSFSPLLALGSPVDTVFDLAFAPGYPDEPIVAACTLEGLALSGDGGRSWRIATHEALYDDQRDPWLLRGGGWEPRSLDGAFVFGEHRSNRAGDRAVLPFVGRGVTLLGSRGPDHGSLRIFLDGRELAQVDAWSPRIEAAATLFESAELEPAFHSLEVEVSGDARPASTGTWVAVDAALVRFEVKRAGSLPVLARREALTLGADVSYGRDVRAIPVAAATAAEVVPGADGASSPPGRSRLWLYGLLGVAIVALAVRRRRACRS